MLRRLAVEASRRCRGPLAPSRSPLHESYLYWCRQCSTSSRSSANSETPDSTYVKQLEDSASGPTAKISIDRSGLYNPTGTKFIYRVAWVRLN